MSLIGSSLLVFVLCISLHVVLRGNLNQKHAVVPRSRVSALANVSLQSGEDQGYNMHSYDMDLLNATTCVKADTLFLGRPLSGAMAVQKHNERPIPFLGTNVDYDVMGWTERLFDGLDFPVTHKFLAVGGCGSDVLQQVSSLQAKHPELHIFRAVRPMGELGRLLGTEVCQELESKMMVFWH